MNNEIHFLKRGERPDGSAKTGVSLHCHTLHSKELLDFVPYYAERIPVISYFWRREVRRRNEMRLPLPNFKKGYWTPPLDARDVYDSEQASMTKLGLDAIVSITDHDSINAGLELRDSVGSERAPISLEWTVPYENAFFHVGVHNLPADRAEAISSALLAYSFAKGEPDKSRLRELLALLNELPDTLVVLNHPIWDIEMIGQQNHERALSRFLAEFSGSFHALEVNGFRSWAENQMVIDLAEALRLPLVSGGDRHCCQANTMINITDAASFAEFVSEVRRDKFSRIAITPEYNVPLPSRQLRSIAQVLGTYNHFPEGRRQWTDRVFLDYGDGEGLRTLTELWGGQCPVWTYPAFFAMSALAHPFLEPLIALTVGDNDIGRNDQITNGGTFGVGGTPVIAGQ